MSNTRNLGDLAEITVSDVVTTSDVGVSVQAYDATILKSADIGVNVQAYDATLLNDADIGVTVQGYDATTLKSADIGTSVQAYDSNLTSFVGTFTLPTTDGTANQVLTTNASGTLSFADAAGGGALELISTTTISGNPSTVDITSGFSSTYDNYIIYINELLGSASATIYARLFYGGSGTPLSSNYIYVLNNGTGNWSLTSSGSRFDIGIVSASLSDNIKIELSGVNEGTGEETCFISNSRVLTLIGGRNNTATGAVSGIRILPSTGTLAAGTIYLYGIKKS